MDELTYARFSDHGDWRALEELFTRWHLSAYQVAFCICRNHAFAEEAVQEAFLKIVSRKGQFKSRGAGSFRAWFLTMVTNCARMVRRSESRAEMKRNLARPVHFDSKAEHEPGSGASTSGDWDRLQHALGEIQERWRRPVVMHFVEGMPQKELAETLGLSQQMVSRRITQGLSKLRLRLDSGARAKLPLTPIGTYS